MDISRIKNKSQQVIKLQSEISDALLSLGNNIAAKYPDQFKGYITSVPGELLFLRNSGEEYDYMSFEDCAQWGTCDDDGEFEPYSDAIIADLESWQSAVYLAQDADVNF